MKKNILESKLEELSGVIPPEVVSQFRDYFNVIRLSAFGERLESEETKKILDESGKSLDSIYKLEDKIWKKASAALQNYLYNLYCEAEC